MHKVISHLLSMSSTQHTYSFINRCYYERNSRKSCKRLEWGSNGTRKMEKWMQRTERNRACIHFQKYIYFIDSGSGYITWISFIKRFEYSNIWWEIFMYICVCAMVCTICVYYQWVVNLIETVDGETFNECEVFLKATYANTVQKIFPAILRLLWVCVCVCVSLRCMVLKNELLQWAAPFSFHLPLLFWHSHFFILSLLLL